MPTKAKTTTKSKSKPRKKVDYKSKVKIHTSKEVHFPAVDCNGSQTTMRGVEQVGTDGPRIKFQQKSSSYHYKDSWTDVGGSVRLDVLETLIEKFKED